MSTTLLILLVTLCTIGSQLLLKHSAAKLVGTLSESGVFGFLMAAAQSPSVIAALGIQITGYVLWLLVLARAQLSVAFAISGSFFYLLMAAASWVLFDERLTGLQWLGLVLISAGVILVTQGAATVR